MIIKRRKVLFITAGVIILGVFAVVLVLLLRMQALKPEIEAAASNALGMDVRIQGRLGIALVPVFGISLKGVSVRNGEADVATVEKIGVGLKLIPLIRREVRISRVRLIKPVFSVIRYKDGRFNVERPGRGLSKKPLAMRKITISQGRLVFTDEISGKRLEVDDFDATVRKLRYDGTDGAEPFKNISFAGRISCGRLATGNFTLTNIEMRAAGKEGILDVNPVSMDIFGGSGSGSIRVDVTGATPQYRVIAALYRIRIEELIQASGPGGNPKKIVEGMVNAAANVTAEGKSVDEVKRSLNGDLSLSGENLMLYSVDIDAIIPKYERSQNFNLVDVGAFFLAGPFGPVLTKSYNFGSLYEESLGGKGLIRKLVSVWKVNKGIAEAADVALASEKHRLAMKGGLNFNNDRFVDVTVAVLDKRGCAVYSQKVHGPFRKPRIEKVSIFKSIGGAVSNALKDAWQFIQGEECDVFYSGSVAHPDG